MVQLNLVPVFGAKKITVVTIWRKFSTEIPVQMVSAHGLAPIYISKLSSAKNAKYNLRNMT